MTVQTTSNLPNSIRAQYVAKYYEFQARKRLYDQIAQPIPGIVMQDAMRGSSVIVPFLSAMAPATTAISQTADITPQILRDATKSITPTSRADALQWSELLEMQAYTNRGEETIKRLADNEVESVELVAIEAALAGSWVRRAAARASLDAGTPGHRASDSLFRKYSALLGARKVPGFLGADNSENWVAIMHDYAFHDIAESGNVDAIGLYQNQGIHLNFELGKIGPFRLVVSPFAKVFWAAGAANGTPVATTVNSTVNRLDTTLVTAADVSASIAAGEHWMVGTIETGSTFNHTNEVFSPVSASTVTLSVVGEAENDGFRYKHDIGETVSNADPVYSIVFAGPTSLVKLYDVETGEFGSAPIWKEDGLVNQFRSVGWKWYGGYARLNEKMILRQEVSSSYDS